MLELVTKGQYSHQFKVYFDIYYNSIKLVWSLDPNKRLLRAVRYIVKGLLHPYSSINWASALKDIPELSLWFHSNPRLILKPSRHYICRSYNFVSRVNIILNNYSILSRLVSPTLYQSLAKGNLLLMADMEGKHGERYQITLSKTDKFDREGELLLGLRNSTQDLDVFWFAFSITRNEDQPRIEIGCFQGPRGNFARERIKCATKELYGIRPRNILADALYELASNWRIPMIFGVCNRSRVYNGHQTHADYDAFWLELGGVLDRDGMFRLPAKLFHYQLSDIPSHHRSEYKRRIRLREELSKQMILVTKKYEFLAEKIALVN